MKIYIAGPMSGYPEHNFPAFFEAEKTLHRRFAWVGLDVEVVNPAKINEHLGTDQEWHVYLRNDIKQLVECDTIYLLKGWEASKGATLEFHIAERLGMKIYYQ